MPTPGPSMRILIFDVTVIFRFVAHLFRERATSRRSQDQINGTEHAVYVCDACVNNSVKHFTVIHFSSKLYYFKVVVFFNFYVMYGGTII